MTIPKEQRQPGALVWRFSDDPLVLEQERRAGGWHPANLRKGFNPATVIDVGAAHGTPTLYEAFPDSYHVLIEPMAEYEESLRRLVQQQGGEYLLVAVGDEQGTATLNFDSDALWRTSILESVAPHDDQSRSVPLTTLDVLREQRAWRPPFGLKIDVEGFEDHVIRGAQQLLKQTQYIIAEVGIVKRFEGSYSFAEFIALMDAAGFKAIDILDGMKGWHAGVAAFADILFARK